MTEAGADARVPLKGCCRRAQRQKRGGLSRKRVQAIQRVGAEFWRTRSLKRRTTAAHRPASAATRGGEPLMAPRSSGYADTASGRTARARRRSRTRDRRSSPESGHVAPRHLRSERGRRPEYDVRHAGPTTIRSIRQRRRLVSLGDFAFSGDGDDTSCRRHTGARSEARFDALRWSRRRRRRGGCGCRYSEPEDGGVALLLLASIIGDGDVRPPAMTARA